MDDISTNQYIKQVLRLFSHPTIVASPNRSPFRLADYGHLADRNHGHDAHHKGYKHVVNPAAHPTRDNMTNHQRIVWNARMRASRGV